MLHSMDWNPARALSPLPWPSAPALSPELWGGVSTLTQAMTEAKKMFQGLLLQLSEDSTLEMGPAAPTLLTGPYSGKSHPLETQPIASQDRAGGQPQAEQWNFEACSGAKVTNQNGETLPLGTPPHSPLLKPHLPFAIPPAQPKKKKKKT